MTIQYLQAPIAYLDSDKDTLQCVYTLYPLISQAMYLTCYHINSIYIIISVLTQTPTPGYSLITTHWNKNAGIFQHY